MPLQKLQFRPGINRESTSYSNEGGWFDCDKVRFRAGYAEKIGGWTKYSTTAFAGTCRALFPWTTLDGTNFIGVGTEQKYYISAGGTYFDITPLRDLTGSNDLQTSAGDATFVATNGSNILTVTENSHGARVGDYVTYSGAAALDGSGNVTATVLNSEHQITQIINNNSYKIDVSIHMNTTAINSVSGLSDSATTVTVDDTSSFKSSGTLKIGDEFITYTGKTATTFTGLTRGSLSSTAVAHNDNASVIETANSSDAGSSSNGGSSTIAKYQISVGLDSQAYGNGWGAGIWNGVNTNSLTTTLAADLNDSDGSFNVASATGLANSDIIQVDDELMIITNITSATLTVTRGHGGTTAATHLNGETVRLAHGNATTSDDYVNLINGSGMASDATVTTATVDSSAGFATSGYIKIEDEIIQYTSKADGTSISGLVRGAFGTTAATHADNIAVFEASAGWGIPVDSTIAGEQLRVWSHDNFGEDLIINVRDSDIYYWDASTGTAARAVKLSTLSNSNKAPTVSRFVVTSDIDRHILFFGCDPEGSTGVQDPLLIRFGDQESNLEFETKLTNTAGELRIGTGSEIVAVKQTKQQILVWTDISLHTVQYVGPPFTFGLQEISRSITIIGPNAAVAVNDVMYWMGKEEFYVYSGKVQKIPCTVKDFVFSDFNRDQDEKVFAGHNSAYGEVWWFYCSADSTTNDKYVIYNYEQNIWYFGNLDRTAWIDRGTSQYPIAASTDKHLYYHEFGEDDGSTNPASGISAHIESSQIDIGDGEQFLFAKRIIPDITFRDSTHPTPAAVFTLKAREYPGTDYFNNQAGAIEQSSSSPVELFTNKIDTRVRGRSFAIRVSSTNEGTAWRLGTPRIDLRPDGRR